MFASDGPVWLDPRPLPADALLGAYGRDELVCIYNLEMERRRAAGAQPDETVPLDAECATRPHGALVAAVEALRDYDTTTRLCAPHSLCTASIPALAPGTLLVSEASDGARTYAVVEAAAPLGRVKLRFLMDVLDGVERVGNIVIERYSCHVAEKTRTLTDCQLAVFEPCPRPGTRLGDGCLMPNAHWRLHSDRRAGVHYAWALADASEVRDGVIVWEVRRGDDVQN